MITVPAGMGHPAQRGGLTRQPEVDLGRALHAQRFFDERADQTPVSAQAVLEFGLITEDLHGRAEQFGHGLLAGREQEGGRPDHLQ